MEKLNKTKKGALVTILLGLVLYLLTEDPLSGLLDGISVGMMLVGALVFLFTKP